MPNGSLAAIGRVGEILFDRMTTPSICETIGSTARSSTLPHYRLYPRACCPTATKTRMRLTTFAWLLCSEACDHVMKSGAVSEPAAQF